MLILRDLLKLQSLNAHRTASAIRVSICSHHFVSVIHSTVQFGARTKFFLLVGFNRSGITLRNISKRWRDKRTASMSNFGGFKL
jgi:hypothetical protein